MMAPVQPGDVLRQKYRVDRLLGEGGMGYVVAAWHVVLGQRVAIKLLRPEVRTHPEVAERFLREARAMSRIESAHVARVIDVDTLEDGTPYLVMEHLEGSDLSSVRRTGQRLAPREAVAHVLDACEALVEAHALGIVHRDLKPANLFLVQKRDRKPMVKVLDFGISKVGGATEALRTTLTQDGIAMGSPEYMAPEQTQSARDVDARADIWSLGVILYELCTAEGPFAGNSYGDVCAKLLTAQPQPPSERAPDLPLGLEAVILRCLQKDPAKRFGSVVELRAALAPFAAAPEPAADTRAPAPADSSPRPPIAAPEAATPRDDAVAPSAARRAPGESPWIGAKIEPRPRPAAASPAQTDSKRGAAAPAAPASQLPWKLIAGAGAVVIVIVVLAFALGRRDAKGPVANDAKPAPSGRFVTDNTLAEDTKTKLAWERYAPSGDVDWSGAFAYCDGLRLRDGSFRLPSLNDLTALSEALRKGTDPNVFPRGSPGYYWSQTPVEGVPRQVWIVRLSDGDVSAASVSGRARVRCVR